MKTKLYFSTLFLIFIFNTNTQSQTWNNYKVSNSGLINNQVNTICIDKLGNKWIGTMGGVSRFDGTTWTNYTTNNGLYNNQVYSILCDHIGNMWFGTYGAISKFDGLTWTSFVSEIPSTAINTLVEDSTGAILFGCNFGIIKRYNGITWASANYAFCPEIKSLKRDKNNKLICGAYMDVSIYNNSSWSFLPANFNTLSCLEINKNNKIFCGNETGTVKVLNGNIIDTTFILPGWGKVNSICFDSLGNTWFATSQWLIKLSNSVYTIFNASSGITTQNLKTLALEGNGTIWTAGDSGVFKMNCALLNTPVFSFGVSNACPEQTNLFYCLVPDSNATSYQWKLPSFYFGSSNSFSLCVSLALGAISDTIKIRTKNICDISNEAKFPVIIKSPISYCNPITSDSGSHVLHGQTNVIYSIQTMPEAMNYLWSYSGNGATINGNSNQVSVDFSLTATSGQIQVKAIDSCGKESPNASFNVDVDGYVGLDIENSKHAIIIFPIPAQDEIYLNFSEQITENVQICIMDLSGKVLIKKNINNLKTTKIDISSLESGSYLIRFKLDNISNSTKNYKLVKQ